MMVLIWGSWSWQTADHGETADGRQAQCAYQITAFPATEQTALMMGSLHVADITNNISLGLWIESRFSGCPQSGQSKRRIQRLGTLLTAARRCHC